jgi:hypothetical protein
MKKIIFASMCCVALAVLSLSATAKAADFVDGWVGCTPVVVGPNNGDVMVKLASCGDGRSGWAMLSTTGTDQMMASFLTAMSLGKPVSVNMSGTAVETGGSFAYSKVVAVQLSME